MIQRKTPLKRTPLKRKPRKKRDTDDPAYLAWLRKQPCAVVVCGQRIDTAHFGCVRATEAAHVGIRGLGRKCPDREAIPLCAIHHRIGNESHHVLGKRFWRFHQLDRENLTREYNALYEAEGGKLK